MRLPARHLRDICTIALLITLHFFTSAAHAAACCGGGASFPNLIVSDDRRQLGISASYAKVIGDAPSSGAPTFRSPSDREWSQIYSVEGSSLISDRWQLGASVPLERRSRTTLTAHASQWGLGDIYGTLGWEALPEYTYSKWKPRGFLFFQITFATGKSIYNSTEPFAMDAMGKGLFTPALGAIFVKSWNVIDTALRFAISRSLNRSFESSDSSVTTVIPGVDFNSSLNMGYNPANTNLRFGLALNPTYTAKTNLAHSKLVWNTALEASTLVHRHWSLGLSYIDQTLIGPAINTSLERSFSIFFRHKWDR